MSKNEIVNGTLFPVKQESAIQELEVEDIALEEAYELFESMDIADNTKKEYKLRVKSFLQFLVTNTLNPNTLIEYKKSLRNNVSMKVSTKNKYLAVAKVYLKELYRTGVIETDITANIKSFSQSKLHRNSGHTSEEVKELLASISTLRDKTIIYLLALQGLRQCEVVRLEAEDINFDDGTIMIQGKGKDDKERVHLHSLVKEILSDYIDSYCIRSGKVFGISERTIRRIHKKYASRLGIKATTHGLRHFFTTKLLKEMDGKILEVAKFTRHKSPDMLIVYNDEISTEESLPTFEKAFKEF